MQSLIGTPVRTAALAALVDALVVPLGLAGCGRKAGLDPPPSAAVPQQNALEGPEHDAIGADGKPVAPPTVQRKRFPLLDWLID